MKLKDLEHGDGRPIVLYGEQDDASYGAVQTRSFVEAEYARDAAARRDRDRLAGLGRLSAGEVSPVGFYMDLYDITVADVAARVGVARWRVRRHRRPAIFVKLSRDLLERYARVFGVSYEDLVHVPLADGSRFDSGAPMER